MARTTCASLGFTPAAEIVKPATTLTLAVNALEKCGKTRFILTAPKPIALINFDRDIQQDLIDELGINAQTDLFIKTIEVSEGDAEDIWLKQWRDVKQAYSKVLDLPEIATVAVDTADQCYELSRLGNFGKLTQVPPFKYAIVNTEMRLMIKEANKRGKNVIWTHRLKKEYKQNKKGDDSWSGKYIPAGWAGAQFDLEAAVILFKDNDGFNCEIINSGIRSKECVGEVMMNDDITFPMVASMITGTMITDWM